MKQTEQNNIVYIGNFRLPNKNASANRVVNNAKALREIGYKVILIGINDFNTYPGILKTKTTYFGFECYELPYPKKGAKWLKFNEQFSRFIAFVESDIFFINNLKLVIVYGSPSLSFWGNKIRKWCINNKIPFVADVVDWMPTRGNLIFGLVKWVDTNYQKRFLNSKADGIIAISSAIKNYYKKKIKEIIIVPPLTDMQTITTANFKRKDNILNLIYIGNPFIDILVSNIKEYKDRLDKVIELFNQLIEEGINNFRFSIYGISKENYLKNIPHHTSIISKNSDYIKFFGQVSFEEAVAKLRESDYFIFLRDITKMTTFGFPTKFVDAFSNGIPTITNRTSDLDKYLSDGENGFFLDFPNMNRAKNKLKIILQLPDSEVLRIRNNLISNNNFNYKNYTYTFNTFINRLEEKNEDCNSPK